MGVQIKNMDGLTLNDIQHEIANGGRFVIFSYTISVVLMTFKRPTDIYFIKAGESDISYSWQYALLTLCAGWWGIPFGPIYSVMSLIQAFKGKDVTQLVVADLQGQAQRANKVMV